MPEPIKLGEIAIRYADPEDWSILRSASTSDLGALTYLNAAYPDERNPADFFWGTPGMVGDAVRVYHAGRRILSKTRSLFGDGAIAATGVDVAGKRVEISRLAWLNLWPVFATNWVQGPDLIYTDVQVREASVTPHYKLQDQCIAWLNTRRSTGRTDKKLTLYSDARRDIGPDLTHAIFGAAYLIVHGRGRGRPSRTRL